MVPHSNDTINGGQQPVSHKRAKSGRVAPAIPYALVKPKTKAKQAALEPIIDTKKPDAVLLPSDNSSTIKHEQAAAIPDHGPETPASVESIQDKADVPELDTPVESVSDHIHGRFSILHVFTQTLCVLTKFNHVLLGRWLKSKDICCLP